MLSIFQFVLFAALTCAVLFLLYDRWKTKASPEESDRLEMVSRAELDSYHHRVVQLYQTHRDWCRAKFEETDFRFCRLEEPPPSRGSGIGPCAPTVPNSAEPPEKGREESPPWSTAPPDPVTAPRAFELESVPEPPLETIPSTESFALTESKVLEAWAAGRSVDQIAQDLRIGRQEVQLLIQVSRKRPASVVGA